VFKQVEATSRERADGPPPDAAEEQALFGRARLGDTAAYGELARRLQGRLYNGVLRLMGDRDEAAEIVQEALLKGLQKMATHRGESGPYTWLFRIAMNLGLSRLRQVRRRRTFTLGAAAYRGDGVAGRADEAEGPGAALDRRDRDAFVLAALGRIDAEHRALIVMRDLEGFDYQQMAALMEVPLGTLKSRLFRARAALRAELEPLLGVEGEGAR
jgi:RNA polymerase sigma-70 factor (ECF subfamily)